MSQKNLWADQGTATLHWVVVAGTACQLDCPAAATESPMGAQMDLSLSERGKDLVFGAIETSPPTPSTRESDLGAVGAPYPYQAQKSEEPVGFLWGRSYCQRVARFGHPLSAFDSHDSSDSGSTPPRDPQMSGPLAQGPAFAVSLGAPAERCPSDRLHYWPLPVLPASGGHSEPEGCGDRPGRWYGGARPSGAAGPGFSGQRLEAPWGASIFANGQRYELDGRSHASSQLGASDSVVPGLSRRSRLYPRATPGHQRSRRALQRPVARKSLEAVSVSDAGATAKAFFGFPGRLQYLPQAKAEPSGISDYRQSRFAISATRFSIGASPATLSRADLVYPESE